LKAEPHNDPDLKPSTNILELTRDDWYKMDKPLFNQLFKKSAVKRTRFKGLKRNLKFVQTKSDG